MHDFVYITRTEAKPVRDNLYAIIHEVQDIVRPCFTFQFKAVGSSSRNMITCDRKSSIGFDFDFDLEINDDDENYSPEEIRHIMRNALNRVVSQYGYKYCEDSTRVLTIRKTNAFSRERLHSCDFALVHNCMNKNQQYIRYNKNKCNYTWEFQGKGYKNLEKRIAWLRRNGCWNELKDYYIYKKNYNNDLNKHSRSIFAESINEVYEKNCI